MVPRSSVEYLSSAWRSDFTSPVIRSPVRIHTESVFCASAVLAENSRIRTDHHPSLGEGERGMPISYADAGNGYKCTFVAWLASPRLSGVSPYPFVQWHAASTLGHDSVGSWACRRRPIAFRIELSVRPRPIMSVRRCLSLGLFALGVAWSTGAAARSASAQSSGPASAAESAVEAPTAPVMVDGITLFRVRGISSYPA